MTDGHLSRGITDPELKMLQNRLVIKLTLMAALSEKLSFLSEQTIDYSGCSASQGYFQGEV